MKINLYMRGDKSAGKFESIQDPKLPSSELLSPDNQRVEKETGEELTFHNDSVEKDDWMKSLPGYQDEVKIHEELEAKHRAKARLSNGLRSRLAKK